MSSTLNGRGQQNLLELHGVTAGYGAVTVLRNINLNVEPSTVVAILGPNGAGKTTLLRAATGLVKPTQGRILLDGENVTGSAPHALARRGFCLVPEGRGIFPSLSVRENLILACSKGKDAVSYTHLDVYKRQAVVCARARRRGQPDGDDA